MGARRMVGGYLNLIVGCVGLLLLLTAAGPVAARHLGVRPRSQDRLYPLINSVSFSPDSRSVAAGLTDGTVRVWDVQSGRIVKDLKVSSGVKAIVFSPKGSHIAAATGASAAVWQVGSWKKTLALKHRGPTHSLAFSPDGKSLACGSTVSSGMHVQSGEAWLWDLATGRLLKSVDTPRGAGSLSFLQGGNRVVLLSRGVRVWDLRRDQLGREIGDVVNTSGMVTAPGGGRVAYSTDREIVIWNTGRWNLLRRISNPKGYWSLGAIAWSPDGRSIAAGADSLLVYDSRTGKVTRSIKTTLPSATALAYSPDGKLIAAGSRDSHFSDWPMIGSALDLIDPRTGNVVRTLTGHVNGIKSMSYSPDGRRVVSCGYDGAAKVWEAHTGNLIATLPHPAKVESAAFSSDGRSIVCGIEVGGNPMAVWWTPSITKLVRQIPTSKLFPASRVYQLRLSRNGKWMIGEDFGRLCAWQANTGKRTAVIDEAIHFPGPLILSADGRLAACVNRKDEMCVYDLHSGATVCRIPRRGQTVGLTISRDKKLLAASGRVFRNEDWQPWIGVWSLKTGKPLKIMENTRSSPMPDVPVLAFSPDGRTLATTDSEGVCLRRASDLSVIRRIAPDGISRCAEFSPNGKKIAVDVGGYVREYDAETRSLPRNTATR